MKTTVEVNGYEIVIEEKDGLITVSATKDDEVVEEFELETEEGQDSEEVQGFDEFGQDEEEDFEDEDSEFEDEDSEDEDEDSEFEDEDENGAKLESFQSFINKRK